MKRVSLVTMGCRANFADTAGLASLLQQKSFEIVAVGEVADAYVINSCTVTAHADRDVVKWVQRCKRANPDALVVVTGCAAQTNAAELVKVQGIHYIVGNNAKGEVVQILEEERIRPLLPTRPFVKVGRFNWKKPIFSEPVVESMPGRSRAFLKVQDGCDAFCSFCIIPYARGPSRSRSLPEIVDQINRFSRMGILEVILSGIHLGAWGRDFSSKQSLLGLLHAVETETDIPSVRISSIEPMQLQEDVLDFWVRSKKICSFLHLSIQSGSNTILQRMRRSYAAEHCMKIVDRFKEARPDAFIGFDVIVGFPGESEAYFEATRSFLEEAPFSKLHVFPFSPRPGTAAAKFPDQIPLPVIKPRMEQLLTLSETRYFAFQNENIEKKLKAIPIGGRNVPQKYITDNGLQVLVEAEGRGRVDQRLLHITNINNGNLYGNTIDFEGDVR